MSNKLRRRTAYRDALIGLLGLMLTAAAGAAAPAGEPAAPAPADHPKTRTPVKLISDLTFDFPQAARDAGEFGNVVVTGTVGVDGRLHDAKVTRSTRSALLDATALAAASAAVFEPGRDEQGVAVVTTVNVPHTFSNARTPGKGGGALRYRCDQFVKDYDWWYKTWPADQHDDFYYAVLGYSTIAKAQASFGTLDGAALSRVNNDFDSRWRAAVEDCRKSPDSIFIDVFQPEGALLRRIAGG